MDVNDAESKVRSCYSTMDVTGSNQRQSDDEKIQILDIPRGRGGGVMRSPLARFIKKKNLHEVLLTVNCAERLRKFVIIVLGVKNCVKLGLIVDKTKRSYVDCSVAEMAGAG